MDLRGALVTVILALTALAGCADNEAPADTSGSTRVELTTSEGVIVAELFNNKTPISVSNFKTYVNEGFYKDLLFHRLMKGFMVQTGGMQEDGTFKAGTHPAIKNEAKTSGLKNLKYTLSMARTNAADSATNQFFINTVDNCFLDARAFSACPDRAGVDGYAVFGIVVEGKDVVDKIEAKPVHVCASGEKSCPDEKIFLRSAKVIA